MRVRTMQRRWPPSRPRRALNGGMTMTTQTGGSMKLKLFLAWGFVGIPLIWGVLQTLDNAMKLFR